MFALNGQREYERVAVELAGRQHLEPGERDRNNEGGKYQQVERERPACRPYICIFVGFHDGDVELPRQAEDRGTGQYQLRDEHVGHVIEPERR